MLDDWVMNSRSILALGLYAASALAAHAASFTADPEAWRPVAYSDLRLPVGDAASYASIWSDLIEQNNAQSAAPNSPPANYAVGNRPAAAWHFTVNFQNKLVVFTTLFTVTSCTREIPSPSAGTRIWVCPARVVTFQGEEFRVNEGAGCWLEKLAGREPEDSTATVVYAAYDVTAKAFRTRAIVAHQEIPACAGSIPLY
jgi:hypothetical protein